MTLTFHRSHGRAAPPRGAANRSRDLQRGRMFLPETLNPEALSINSGSFKSTVLQKSPKPWSPTMRFWQWRLLEFIVFPRARKLSTRSVQRLRVFEHLGLGLRSLLYVCAGETYIESWQTVSDSAALNSCFDSFHCWLLVDSWDQLERARTQSQSEQQLHPADGSMIALSPQVYNSFKVDKPRKQSL